MRSSTTSSVAVAEHSSSSRRRKGAASTNASDSPSRRATSGYPPRRLRPPRLTVACGHSRTAISNESWSSIGGPRARTGPRSCGRSPTRTPAASRSSATVRSAGSSFVRRGAVRRSSPPRRKSAAHLLDWRRRRVESDGRLTVAVLEDNAAGRSRLAADGWTEQEGGPRMIRGEPLVWRPDWIYGQFNGALG